MQIIVAKNSILLVYEDPGYAYVRMHNQGKNSFRTQFT